MHGWLFLMVCLVHLVSLRQEYVNGDELCYDLKHLMSLMTDSRMMKMQHY